MAMSSAPAGPSGLDRPWRTQHGNSELERVLSIQEPNPAETNENSEIHRKTTHHVPAKRSWPWYLEWDQKSPGNKLTETWESAKSILESVDENKFELFNFTGGPNSHMVLIHASTLMFDKHRPIRS